MKNTDPLFPPSDHFKNGRFFNLSPTPVMSPDSSTYSIFRNMLRRPRSVRPAAELPHVKRELHSPDRTQTIITWFGHSSYLIQSGGITILVDPVFSGHASPLSSMIRAFPGSDAYTVNDMPTIDILVISHNHYDHLDKNTLKKLMPKTKAIITGMGVGNDLRSCGATASMITELDWWQSSTALPGIRFTATPARHFSGRGLIRGQSLWCSFVLELPTHRIFIGGDSGYDSFFEQIGREFGPFDLAILECGQYNTAWPFIHMMPEETAIAGKDLRAKRVLPVHWAKFTLANHPWDEPIKRLVAEAEKLNIDLTTPMIGQPVILDKDYPVSKWWEQV